MRRVQTEVDAPFYAQFRRSLGSLPPIPTIPLYNLAVDRLSVHHLLHNRSNKTLRYPLCRLLLLRLA